MADPQHTTPPLRLVKEIPLTLIARDAVATYRHRQQLGAAREIIACVATEHGHALGSWRVEGADRFALVQCKQCGSGARMNLDDATTRIAGGLSEPCPGMAVTRV